MLIFAVLPNLPNFDEEVTFMFFIGDIIFYPVYGAGYIYNIEEKEFYGCIKKYYIINFINGMGSMVPVNSDESKKIRNSISEHESLRVFEILKEDPQKLPSKWSERYKHYNHSIRCGDIFKMTEVLKDIKGLSMKKTLSKSDLKIFFEILGLVAGEIALVLNISFSDARNSMLELLEFNENNC
jgi:CarD family transcriptional regulator